MLLAISTSGGSPSVLDAAKVARSLGIAVVALTSSGANRLADLADVVLAAPGEGTAAIQEAHRRIYHVLCESLELVMFGR